MFYKMYAAGFQTETWFMKNKNKCLVSVYLTCFFFIFRKPLLPSSKELGKPPKAITDGYQDVYPLCARCQASDRTWHTRRPKRGAKELQGTKGKKKKQ